MEVPRSINYFRKKDVNSEISNQLQNPIRQIELQKLIPQRDPFFFLDSLDSINLDEKLASFTRFIDPADPVFKGHFPDDPIYPGVLLQEMMFQAGLVLVYFLKQGSLNLPKEDSPLKAVAVGAEKIALFHKVLPNDTVKINCFIEDNDDLLVTCIAQIVTERGVAAVAKGDFYIE